MRLRLLHFDLIQAVLSPTFKGTQEEWRVTFFISGAVSLFGGLIFVILGEDGIADWAKNHDKTQNKNSEEKDAIDFLPVYSVSKINSESLTEKF